MDRLLLFRPPKPSFASPPSAADGDLLELDVLWPPSAAPGLLAALPDDEKKKKKKRVDPVLRSAARPIQEMAAAAPASSMARSVPVRIPSAEARRGRWANPGAFCTDGEGVVPPHEIVARRAAHSSVLEGAGRTLKGRDLRRARDAVWRRTGFVD